MATITGFTTNLRPRHKITITSDAATPSDIIELSGLPTQYSTIFAAVQLFDGGGSPIDAGTAGDFVVKIQTEPGTIAFEKPPNSTITALAPTTISWVAPTTVIQITPTDLAGVTTWKLVLTLKL